MTTVTRPSILKRKSGHPDSSGEANRDGLTTMHSGLNKHPQKYKDIKGSGKTNGGYYLWIHSLMPPVLGVNGVQVLWLGGS